jgi:hypothetical protein
MKLTEIHRNFNSDKGIEHNYIPKYEELFSPIRENKMNVLELGVLFGNSLKLWEHYFENSMIYGIDNFIVDNGHSFHKFKPIVPKDIISDLSKHDRIIFFELDCENENLIHDNLKDLKFDIIIDDASHKIEQQKNNYRIFNKYLKDNFIYVCEDVQTNEHGLLLVEYFKSLSPNKKVEMINFNVNMRSDDRIVIVT